MAAEVGTAVVSIIPSARGFGRALQSQIGGDLSMVGTNAGRTMGGKTKVGFLGSLGALAKSAGPLMLAAGVVAGGAFAAGFVKNSITAASDLNESINAVNVTFGKNADGILKLGEGAAQSLGLSRNEFNGLAVQFSNFSGVIAGKGGDVVGVFDDLSTRAADFASVMNLDVNEAATLFQSGLAGETEPLRKFGIDLSAAAVEAHAYKTGIAEAGTELTENQKIQSRYSLLMEKTSKTQGDFANTSDSLANSQRRLGASWEDLQAKIGQKFLPIAADAVNMLGKIVSAVGGDRSAMRELGGLGDLLAGIGKGFKSAWDIVSGTFSDNRGMFDGFGRMLTDTLLPALGKLAEHGIPLVARGFEMWVTTIKGVSTAVLWMVEVVADAFGNIVELIAGGLGELAGFMADIADNIPGMGDLADDLHGIEDQANTLKAHGSDFFYDMADGASLLREQLGWTAREADYLSNRIKLLPEDLQMMIEADGADETIAQLIEIQKMYELSPEELITYIEARGLDLTERGIEKLNRKYDLMPEEVMTLFKQSGITANEKDVERLQRKYDLTPRQVTTLLKQSGGRLTMREIAALDKTYDLLPRQVVSLLKQTGKEFTEKQVKDLQKQYNLTPKQVETLLKAKNNASPEIGKVKREGQDLDGDVFTTTLRTIRETWIVEKMNPFKRASGGPIFGPGTSTSDSIPALLSNGEYVVKAAAVNKYGMGFFHNLNAMRFANGGAVGAGQQIARRKIGGGRTEFVITNWQTGEGYMREMARDEIDTDDYYYEQRGGAYR